MANSTPIATSSNDTVSCSYQRTVSLYSWWLVKAKNDFQGKRLAIAGVSSKEGEAMRVFVSAPIIKTYDMISLETADGKCIRIHGFINEQRTLENGFMPEVFNSFLFGFPPNWESYAIDCFREESITGNDSGMEKSIPTLVSPEEAPRDKEKPLAENECNVSTEMGGVNVACSSGGNRCSARLRDTEVSQKKKQPASGGPLMHPNNENFTLVDLENCDVQELRNPATPIQSQPWIEFSNDACMKNSIPTLVSPEEAPRDHEKPFSENGCNVSKEMSGVDVACSSGGNRRSARLRDAKISQKKKQPASGGPLKHPNNENSTLVDLENCDVQGLRNLATPIQSQPWIEFSNDACMKNSIPTSLVSPEEAPRDHEEPFSENGCNVSKEMSGVNVACSSGGNRRSARLRDAKISQKKKQPASGGPLKHPNNENSTLVDLENCDVQGLRNPATPIQSQPWIEFSNDACMKNSIPTSLVSPEEAPRDHEEPFSENGCNVSKEMSGVNVACSSGGNRRSARLRDAKISQKKKQPASGGPLKHPNNENSTLVDLENCDVQGLRNPATPIQSQPWIEFSNDACMENSISTSFVSPEEAPRDHEKPFSENGCNVSKEMSRVHVACSSGGNRHSARLHDIKVCQQKKQHTSGGPLKHLNIENSTSVDLENCDTQGLRSPATPIQSQLWRQLSSPPEQLVNKSASRISKTLSSKTKGLGCFKKKSVTVETKVVKPKGKQNKSASAVKNLREKDLRHFIKGNQRKISTVSPQSLSFKISRSGRLLLPPLEFWRNQIPIYDASHEITEIQEGASLISPCRGSSASLGRFSNRKRAA